jgi:hypothetical protein
MRNAESKSQSAFLNHNQSAADLDVDIGAGQIGSLCCRRICYMQRKTTLECQGQSMPALQNPRHERYAQLIVEGLANGDSKPYSQTRAYIAAGYTARDGDRNHRSAQASSSRLLSRVIQRVRELQAIAAQNAAETVEKMARELNEIQYEARADKAHAAAVAPSRPKLRANSVKRSPSTSLTSSRWQIFTPPLSTLPMSSDRKPNGRFENTTAPVGNARRCRTVSDNWV